MKRLSFSFLLFGTALLALPACGDNASSNESEVNCTNNTDDDGDGQVDCADSDCAQNLACNPVEDCTNTTDDDGDGMADCADSDCDSNVACHPVEDCDDGMDNDGDGEMDCADTDCAFECQIEDCTNGADDDSDGTIDCADEDCMAYCTDACTDPVNLAIPANVVGNTTGHGNVTDGTCQTAFGGGGGNEVVYRVVPQQNGVMRVRLSSGTDLGVYILTTCALSTSEIGCSDNFFGGGQETLNLAVSANQELFIVVDEFTATETGSYTLGIDFREIMCGDSIIDPGEQCDPPVAGTCSATCQFEPETLCDNLTDDDGDGLIDCQDSTCTGTAACTSGMTPTGGVCANSSECRANAGDPLCLSETVAGWPSGFCTEFCNVAANDCNGVAYCSDAFHINGGVCLIHCSSAADCRDGYGCVNLGFVEGSACLPACTTDAQCPTVMHCSVPDGLCIPSEICTGGVDEDLDGAIDCVDSDCSATNACVETSCTDGIDNDMSGATDCADADCDGNAACVEICDNGLDDDADGLIDCGDSFCDDVAGCQDSCLGIIELTVPSSGSALVSGTTVGHPNSNLGTCTGEAAGEIAYQVTAPIDGTIRFTLTSDADMGLYVRDPLCADGDEIICRDQFLGPQAKEIVDVTVTADQELFVFVDGFTDFFSGTGAEGPFTLQAQYILPEVCNDTMDNDLDGLIDCNDPECGPDPSCPTAAVCAGAIVLVENVPTNGTTVGGTDDVQGSCTGDLGALERVYSFNAGQAGVTGTVKLTLVSAKDQGMYVRSDCFSSSAADQLGCVDQFPGGTNETLSVPNVVGNETIFIFVDGFSLGNEGAFTLTADFVIPEVCGNGNDDDGDGQTDCADTDCSSTGICTQCLGALPILVGQTAGDTTGLAGTTAGTCMFNPAGPEEVYVYTPLATGSLHVVMTPPATKDLSVYARTVCSGAATELACNDDGFSGETDDITIDVTQSVPVFIFVDSFSASQFGAFTLDLTLTPPP